MTKSFLYVLGFLVIFGCHKSDNPTTPVVTVDYNEIYLDSAGYLSFWESNNNPCYFYEKDGDLMMLNSEKYSYYDMLNKIDIFWRPYYNGIVGKIYKHLIREINGYYGLGAFKISSFSYSLDSGGYILEKNETRNIGNTTQHISDFEYY